MTDASTTTAAPTVDLSPVHSLFERLRRRARRWMQAETIALVCIGCAVFFWATLAVDWLIEPPVAARAAALAVAALGVAWIVATKLVGRMRVPLPDRDLAVLVERHHPDFADSLSTVIDRSGDAADPDLVARTARAAVERLPSIRPERLFREGLLARLLLAGLAGLATIGMLARQSPTTASVWAHRMLMLRDEPWPRQTSLEAMGFEKGVRIVARGSDVDVLARAGGKVPEIVDLRMRSADGGRTERMGTRGGATDEGQLFGHVIEGVRDDTQLTIRGGDARLDGLVLKVLDPPALEKLEIAYTLPAYLGGGRREAPPSGIVQIPRGSAVEISCVATKPLSKAEMLSRSAIGGGTAAATESAPTVIATLSGTGSTRRIAASIPALDSDLSIAVNLTDIDGLSNLKPVGFRIVAAADEPPQVAVRLLGISTAVVPKARLPFVGVITDDHGLGTAEVRIARAAAGSARAGDSQAPGPTTTMPVRRVSAGMPRLELTDAAPETVPLEPLGLVVGDTLTTSISAADTCTLDGEPNSASSDTWTLQVVSPEALAAMLEARELMLRKRFENVLQELTLAREALAAAADPAPAAGRTGEAVARATGETGEIAEAFLLIRREFDNNGLMTPELDTRLFAQIAAPLGEIASADLPRLEEECRRASAAAAVPQRPLLPQIDAVIQRMRAVLDRMMELETFNEVVELLRSAIRTQEEIRTETLRRQKARGKALLEEP